MEEVLKKLAEIEAKIDAVYKSAEKTRKYLMWTLILSVVFFVLPIIAMLFILPSFFNAVSGNLDLLK